MTDVMWDNLRIVGIPQDAPGILANERIPVIMPNLMLGSKGLTDLVSYASLYGVGAVTMRQMKAALASQGKLVTLANAIPAAVEDATNIAWTSAVAFTIADPFASFIQSTLGYTGAQMTALFSLALTEPL